MDRIADNDPAIKKALGVADMLKHNDLERLQYLRRHMAIHEAISDRAESWAQGEAQGKIEGKAEGKIEGLAEGSIKTVLFMARRRFLELTSADEKRIEAAVIRDGDNAIAECGYRVSSGWKAAS